MNNCTFLGVFLVMFVSMAFSAEAYGLDFDKEIAKQERVTVSLVDSFDRKKSRKATKQVQKDKDKVFTVTLISK